MDTAYQRSYAAYRRVGAAKETAPKGTRKRHVLRQLQDCAYELAVTAYRDCGGDSPDGRFAVGVAVCHAEYARELDVGEDVVEAKRAVLSAALDPTPDRLAEACEVVADVAERIARRA